MNISKVRKLHPKLKNIKDSYFNPMYGHPVNYLIVSLFPIFSMIAWMEMNPFTKEGKKVVGIFISGFLIQVSVFGYFILKECNV